VGQYLKHWRHIVAFGLVGTLLQFALFASALWVASSRLGPEFSAAAALTANECMLLAATLSAADEVAILSLVKPSEYPTLGTILLGEGVLNDFLSIVLFRAVFRETGATVGAAYVPPTPSPTPRYQYQHHRHAHMADYDVEAGVVAAGVGGGLALGLFALQICYLLAAAAAIGTGIALTTAAVLQTFVTSAAAPVGQVSVVLLGGYLSFALAELFSLSGVLSVFFCGAVLARYAWAHLSERAREASTVTTGMLSAIAEAYCFVAVGLSSTGSALSASREAWSPTLCAVALAAMVLSRAACIFGLSGVLACCRRSSGEAGRGGGEAAPLLPRQAERRAAGDGQHGPLTGKEQSLLVVGGTIRGAICWAQIVQVVWVSPHAPVLVTTAICCIFATVVGIGGTLPWVLRGSASSAAG